MRPSDRQARVPDPGTGDVATIHIPAGDIYTVHINLLTRFSDYFDKALNSFTSRNLSVEEHATPDTMLLFIKWIYIKASEPQPGYLDDLLMVDNRTFISAWLLGDYLQATEFVEALERCFENSIMDLEVIFENWERIQPLPKLRHYMIDRLRFDFVRLDNKERYEMICSLPEDIACEVFEFKIAKKAH